MKTSTTKPTVTKKWPIEVPTQTYESVASVFRIDFGKHYLLWKGKSLLQACQFIAENIERNIRLQKDDPTDYLYHVVKHIKKTRCIGATAKVIENEFTKGDTTTVNCYKLLMAEQKYLDAAIGDPLCLNNNEQAYIAKWMPQKDVDKFLIHYAATDEKRQQKLKKRTRA
jgi:hypothetical protein